MAEPSQTAAPNPWEPVFQQAVQFHASGQLAEAASLFVAILEYNPSHFPSLQRLTAIRRHQGRLDESLALLQSAVDLYPNSAEARNSLGNTLNALGNRHEAIQQYQHAIALRENFPEAHLNLANSLKSLGRFDEAAAAYQQAIALRPDYVDAHTNLGGVLDRLNRPDDSLASFSAALSFDPEVNLGHNNVGMALTRLNRFAEALPFFQRARQLQPGAPQPVFNEALVRLAMGDFERGWPDYEARWRVPEFKQEPRQFAQPIWDGQSSLAGKTILLHAEQGLGDTILFARFIQPVAERGARVVTIVQKPLVGLIASVSGVAQVLTSADPLPDFDLHAPLGSLPLALKTTLETIPSQTPYLHAPAESDALANLDPADPRPLVGVCWAGNPDYPSDHKRSIPLSIFQQLFQVPGVRFVSLQQNLRAGDDSILSQFDNIDLVSDRKGCGLADTAALIASLDLVITVDTVIGHLAGALGRPVWILLHFNGYWVWLRDRTDSPWYPTARLFRQPHPGDWNTVLQQVAVTLPAKHPELSSVQSGKPD